MSNQYDDEDEEDEDRESDDVQNAEKPDNAKTRNETIARKGFKVGDTIGIPHHLTVTLKDGTVQRHGLAGESGKITKIHKKSGILEAHMSMINRPDVVKATGQTHHKTFVHPDEAFHLTGNAEIPDPQGHLNSLNNAIDERGKWEEGHKVQVHAKGNKYGATKTWRGWRIYPLEGQIQRTVRNYEVHTNPTGTATRCTCPDNVYRGGCCKHMAAINALEEQTKDHPLHGNVHNASQPDADTVKRAGFVRFPPEVAKGSTGARCSNCEYSNKGTCTYNGKEDLRGLKVDNATCCDFWFHKGTKKGEAAVANTTLRKESWLGGDYYDANTQDFTPEHIALSRHADETSKLANETGSANAHRMAAMAHKMAAQMARQGYDDPTNAQNWEGYHTDLANEHMTKATQAMFEHDDYGKDGIEEGGYQRLPIYKQSAAANAENRAWLAAISAAEDAHNKALNRAERVGTEVGPGTLSAAKVALAASTIASRLGTPEAHNVAAKAWMALGKQHQHEHEDKRATVSEYKGSGSSKVSSASKAAQYHNLAATAAIGAAAAHKLEANKIRETNTRNSETVGRGVPEGRKPEMWPVAALIATDLSKAAHKASGRAGSGKKSIKLKEPVSHITGELASGGIPLTEAGLRSLISAHKQAKHIHEMTAYHHEGQEGKEHQVAVKAHQMAARYHTQAGIIASHKLKALLTPANAETFSANQQMTINALSKRVKVLGILAHRELQQTGNNPASWVKDEGKWEKAKSAAGDRYGGKDSPRYWAVVTHIYEKMGGKVKGKRGTHNAAFQTPHEAAGLTAFRAKGLSDHPASHAAYIATTKALKSNSPKDHANAAKVHIAAKEAIPGEEGVGGAKFYHKMAGAAHKLAMVAAIAKKEAVA